MKFPRKTFKIIPLPKCKFVGKSESMKTKEEGIGKLLGWEDPDEARKWMRENKPDGLVDKRTTVSQAVEEYVEDGDLLASGGFGHIRVSMALIYEIMRQEKQDLAMAGKTAVHDIDLLIGAGCVNEVEVAYSFGHELRGLSPASRRRVENGEVEVVAEISNAAFQWRFLAGTMGIPFIPTRVMMGTDTFNKSSAKVIEDPYSGKPIALLPACYPDVGIIHVPRCDKYGNAQIDGINVEDLELSGASKKLILTAEEIIDNEKIREEPGETVIPFYYVDAVVEVPYGSHPCQMPGMYYFDEEHISKWLDLSRTDEGIEEYLDEYVYGTENFQEYLEKVGGEEKIEYLEKVETLEEKPIHPWAE